MTGSQARDRKVRFAGTGQTGILIEGWGIGVDAVIADFIAGAAEKLVLDASNGAEIVLVEGQGSIIHPGYSGVTLGLMHGSLPHAMVMCAQPSRTHINNNPWIEIPPLPEMIGMHEMLVRHLRPAPVIAVSLNTYDLSVRAARAAIEKTRRQTGLPTTDPVRFDSGAGRGSDRCVPSEARRAPCAAHGRWRSSEKEGARRRRQRRSGSRIARGARRCDPARARMMSGAGRARCPYSRRTQDGAPPRVVPTQHLRIEHVVAPVIAPMAERSPDDALVSHRPS